MRKPLFDGLPPVINEKGSLFGVDMVGGPTISLVFLSVYNIYYGIIKQNFSGCMLAFTIRLS